VGGAVHPRLDYLARRVAGGRAASQRILRRFLTDIQWIFPHGAGTLFLCRHDGAVRPPGTPVAHHRDAGSRPAWVDAWLHRVHLARWRDNPTQPGAARR
jgi:hypothetical protein